MDKSQIAKLSLIALLLLITPLLSTSMRPPYLYFLLNLLIIALGAEAGLLSVLKPLEDKKPVVVTPVVAEACPNKVVDMVTNNNVPEGTERKVKIIEKSVSEKIVKVVKVHNVKKCPSMPSLFFIGGGEAEAVEMVGDEEEEEEFGDLSGQELFTKAETFIGNFYKQLKIQREESWKRIHGFCQKAF